MRGVPQKSQQAFALRDRCDSPGADGLVFKRQNPPNRYPCFPYRSSALPWKQGVLFTGAVAEEQRPWIWVYSSLRVYQGKLIGEISGASPQQLGDQR